MSFGSRRYRNISNASYHEIFRMYTHFWRGCCLSENDTLSELDAADADSWWSSIPYAENSRLNSSHSRP